MKKIKQKFSESVRKINMAREQIPFQYLCHSDGVKFQVDIFNHLI